MKKNTIHYKYTRRPQLRPKGTKQETRRKRNLPKIRKSLWKKPLLPKRKKRRLRRKLPKRTARERRLLIRKGKERKLRRR